MLAAGLHVQWRARSDVNLPVLEVLLDGTYLRGSPTAASRRMRHNAQTARTYLGMTVRVIEYTVESKDGSENSETFTLVTDVPRP